MREQLVPPSGPGEISRRVAADGTVVVWARNDAGKIGCTLHPPESIEARRTHVSTCEGGGR